MTDKDNILFLGTNPERYQHLGNIIYFPMIEISEADIKPEVGERIFGELERFHLIIFTSRFAVHYFFQWLKKEKYDLSKLNNIDFAVVGETTQKALAKLNFTQKIIPKVETSVGLWDALQSGYDLKEKRILFPRSSVSNPFLIEKLRDVGCYVDELTMYNNAKPEKKELPNEKITKIIFTSPSTVQNFLEDYGSISGDLKIFSKGPKTSKELEKHGYKSEVLS